MIEEVIASLNALSQSVSLELSSPVVVLDAPKSSDGKEIMAVCGPNPDLPKGPDNPNNHLTVISGNADFRQKVRSGDIVRYFADMKAELDIVTFEYFEMPVAQVIDDNRLILARGLSMPTEQAFKLQVWRMTDDRMEEIQNRVQLYVQKGYSSRDAGISPLGWEPSPDEVTLEQIIKRLNQWSSETTAAGDWRLDPLLATLPEPLRRARALEDLISDAALERLTFAEFEGRWLQQAIWFRDISRWARGDAIDDLGRATALFDWTVRNIQLVQPRLSDPPYLPWEVLLYGRGTVEDRATVFALLCRQQWLDVVVLTPADAGGATNDSEKGTSETTSPLLVALLADEELYLFDPGLGLPVPGPGGQGIATLAQAKGDDAVLRQLDLGDELRYPWTADALGQVRAGIVASPLSLSRRAVALEAQLVSDEKFVLALDASAQAERIRETGQVREIVLWDEPFRVLLAERQLASGRNRERPAEKRKQLRRQRTALEFLPFAMTPALWKARVLHFHGRRGDVIVSRRHGNLEERIDDHQDAKGFYQKIRPTKRDIDRIPSEQQKLLALLGKQNASYWIGLMAFDDDELGIAEDFLKTRTLGEFPEGIWRNGATYNLARTYERLGKADQAIALYEGDQSPQRRGNLIRARRLREE